MRTETPGAGLEIRGKKRHLSVEKCIGLDGCMMYFGGGAYFEKEINAKTRIMILSQYPKNRKNEILNPKVRGRCRCHGDIKSLAWRFFLNLTLIFFLLHIVTRTVNRLSDT